MQRVCVMVQLLCNSANLPLLSPCMVAAFVEGDRMHMGPKLWAFDIVLSAAPTNKYESILCPQASRLSIFTLSFTRNLTPMYGLADWMNGRML